MRWSLLLAVLSATAHGQGAVAEPWVYYISGDEYSPIATITAYTGEGGDVTIPASLGGAAVRFVGGGGDNQRVFNPDGPPITSVTIPEGVWNTQTHAFSDCYSLTNAVILGGNIASGAFRRCANLGSLMLGNGVRHIGENAFTGTALTNLIISDSVEEIGGDAFSGCGGLTNVTFGSGLKRIGARAFQSSPLLTHLYIPDNVTFIADFAFSSCEALTNVRVPLRFAARLGHFGFTDDLASRTLIEVLLSVITERIVASSPVNYGIATKGDLTNSIREAADQAIGQLVANPNPHGLFTLAQNEARYNEGVTAGTSMVTANPASYSLYTSDSIMDLRMNGLMVQKQGSNAVVTFQPQTTTDLSQPFTNNGTAITNEIPMPSNKGFIRIRANPTPVPPLF
jgi:hypothetical protein